MNHLRNNYGFGLIEMLLAVLAAALLIAGLLQLISAARLGFILQENQAEVQETGRLAIAILGRAIRRAGFSPEPWDEPKVLPAITVESQDNAVLGSDRLALRDWSDRNCFDHRNPQQDAEGHPLFYIRESVFDLNTTANLTLTCRYGPSPGSLTTQVRRQGLMRNVESFQALYGEDSDRNGAVDRWVGGGAWGEERDVLGIRIALLVVSDEVVVDPVSQSFSVLDQPFTASADGRLRRSFEFVAALKGRSL